MLIMELRFDAMLYSNLGNEIFDAGNIKCSRGWHSARGFPTPGLDSALIEVVSYCLRCLIVFPSRRTCE